MDLKYLKLFEEFTEGKFSSEDIDRSRKEGKKIFATIVKNLPDNDPKQPLNVVSIDKDTNEITVTIDNNIYYVDLKNVEEIER